MDRRKYTEGFKLEAARLINERGMSYAQAAQDLGVHMLELRVWMGTAR
jgi:transposase-like protein